MLQVIAITLSPPADLEVTSLTVPDTWVTGETVMIDILITNVGGGATFEFFWIDQLVTLAPPPAYCTAALRSELKANMYMYNLYIMQNRIVCFTEFSGLW